MGLELKFLRISPNTKRPIDKFDEAHNYSDIKTHSDIGLIVPDGYVVIDVDDGEQANVLFRIIKDLGIRSKVMQTTRGMHFWFQTPKVITNSIKILTPIGITVDVKCGGKKSYVKIKSAGKVREWLMQNDELDVLPRWLTPNSKSVDFWNLGEGSRNDTFFRYIVTLQSMAFSKDEIKQILKMINDYIMKDPLTEDELEVIVRDEAFETKVKSNQEAGYLTDGKFAHNVFGDLLNQKLTPITVDGTMYIYNRGFYEVADREAERAMVELMPTIRRVQRTEVLEYMKLVTMKHRDEIQQNPYIINLTNTRLNIKTDEELPFSPMSYDFNKLPLVYDKEAYDETMDKTLDKIFSGDKEVRLLFEEFIGYLLLGNNKFGKMILLLGEGSNGKSTILEVLKSFVGNGNYSTLALEQVGEKFATAELENKILNVGDDIDAGTIKMTGDLKKVVTGEEIQVERKNEHPFKLRNKAKLMFSANRLPYIMDKSFGMERRLLIIPMNARFTADDPDYDPFVEDKLKEPRALSYLLNLGLKAIKGVFARNAFTIPNVVSRELYKYKINRSYTLTWLKDKRITLDYILSKSIVNLHNEMGGYLNQIGVKFDKHPSLKTFESEIVREFKLEVDSHNKDSIDYIFKRSAATPAVEIMVEDKEN
mgnify:CR=1 FL=1